jgi:hypothetical protein
LLAFKALTEEAHFRAVKRRILLILCFFLNECEIVE